jgi:hypothetical protein
LKEWPLDEVMEHLASVSCNPKKFEKINTNFSKKKKKKIPSNWLSALSQLQKCVF